MRVLSKGFRTLSLLCGKKKIKNQKKKLYKKHNFLFSAAAAL
jgi:hypothetical protein